MHSLTLPSLPKQDEHSCSCDTFRLSPRHLLAILTKLNLQAFVRWLSHSIISASLQTTYGVPLSCSYFQVAFSIFILNAISHFTRSAFTCSKLTIKKPERRHWRRLGVFIVNSEHISHPVLVFLLLTLNM